MLFTTLLMASPFGDGLVSIEAENDPSSSSSEIPVSFSAKLLSTQTVFHDDMRIVPYNVEGQAPP